MTTHLSSCPVCSHQEFSSYLNCKDYTVSHETYSIVKCNSCGFKFTQDIPDENSIGRYYQAEDYISHSGSKKGIINKLYHVVRARSLKQKFKLVSSYTHGIKLIDYGCGTGEFLNTCQHKGWSVQGYEPSEQARSFAITTNGVKVDSPSELANYPNESADIITLWHVLEHIHQLKPTIQLLLSKLKPGGVFLVAVPNCSSFDAEYYKAEWAAYDVPRHLYHFEPATINNLLHQFGLTRKAIKPMVFDSFYVSLLSEKHKNNDSQGFVSLFKGFLIGLISNLKARKSKQTYSSQIYIYQK